MGNFSINISKRFAHSSKNGRGYCVICSSYGDLSFDHVPPQGSVIITKTEQRLITESTVDSFHKVKGLVSKNGSKFRTICKSCNGVLSVGDNEIARIYQSLTPVIKQYFESPFEPYSCKKIRIDAKKYVRSMIGHILSATSEEECKTEPVETPYFKPLQQFVLGDDNAIAETHEIYYWFYPFRRHISAKMVGFYNNGHLCTLSLLSFFPIAFLVVEKNKGIYPVHAKRLEITDEFLFLDLSLSNHAYITFPFVELTGNRMYAVKDELCIVSYPVGQ